MCPHGRPNAANIRTSVTRQAVRLAAVMAAIALASGCGKSREQWLKELRGGDVSVFQAHAGRYCLITDADDKRRLRVDCARAGEFIDPAGPHCSEAAPFRPAFILFPDHPRAMRACRTDADPERQTRDQVRFLVFGDVGAGQSEDRDAHQIRVAQAMQAVCPSRATDQTQGCDFAVILGDLVYPQGIRSPWDSLLARRFEEPYAGFGRFDMYAIPGNHDYLGNVTAQVEYTWFSDRWRMPARHYAVPDLPSWLSIYNLDTTALLREHDAPDTAAAQHAGLTGEVCGKTGWRVVAGHHPPASNGKHGGSPGIASHLAALTDRCAINLYLAGHDHHQEHLHLAGGFDVVIQGAGGAEIKSVTTREQPEPLTLGDSVVEVTQRYAASAHGFAVVTATSATLEMAFYDTDRWPWSGGGYARPPRADEASYRCAFDRERPGAGCQVQSPPGDGG